MKKIFCVIAAASMLLSLAAGCSDNGGSANNGTTTASTAAEPNAETSADAGDNTSEAAPETKPEDGDNSKEGTVQAIAEKIIAAYGDDYLPNTDIPADILKTLIELEEDSYTEIFAQQPMISAHADVLIIVKAASGKTGEVKSKLEAYRSRLVEDTMQYPMNLPKINASKVVANGDYVAFILLGKIDEREDASDEEMASFAEEQVKIGTDAFEAYFA